ncbi:TPA: hypothetical protein ACWXS4_004481, partial [Escherichia coli]
KKKGRPYDVYNVDGDILNNICEIMSPLLSHFGNVNYPYAKVFSFTADDVDKKNLSSFNEKGNAILQEVI